MIKNLMITAGIVSTLLTMPGHAAPGVQNESFDALASVMDQTKKEINAKSTLKGNREDAERFREKLVAGWWEFMRANSLAKPGEYCTATFMRAKRDIRDHGVKVFKEGVAVTLFGPGGDYRGALLAFTPLSEDHIFPKLATGQKVLITLKQGNEMPTTLNALYMTVGKTALPMIAFVVPSVDDLMAVMEDKWNFELIYQNKSIADIAWHSGINAREELKKCLSGKPFDDKSHLKETT